jgi:predicted signal transduction protein with EAL and GGDEF domain
MTPLCVIAIDDFGTGYSSRSYLKRFPVDTVKVDRSFVSGLGTDPHDTGLVAAIIAMAAALNLQVTAEGVETELQLAHLKKLGCQRAQGFYLARPMPAPAIGRNVICQIGPTQTRPGSAACVPGHLTRQGSIRAVTCPRDPRFWVRCRSTANCQDDHLP